MGEPTPAADSAPDKAGTTSSPTRTRPTPSRSAAPELATKASHWQRLSAECINVFSFVPEIPHAPPHKPAAIPPDILAWQKTIRVGATEVPSRPAQEAALSITSAFDTMSISASNGGTSSANEYSPWRTLKALEADCEAHQAAKRTSAFFARMERRKVLKLVKMPYEIQTRIVQCCADEETNAKQVLAGAVGLRLTNKHFSDLVLDIAIDVFHANRSTNKAFSRLDLLPLPGSFAIATALCLTGKLRPFIEELNCVSYDDEFSFDTSDESARVGYLQLRTQMPTGQRDYFSKKTALAEVRRKDCLEWRRAVEDTLRSSVLDELIANVLGRIPLKHLTLTRVAAERINAVTPPLIPALPRRLATPLSRDAALDASVPSTPYLTLFSRFASVASSIGKEWESVKLNGLAPDNLDAWTEVKEGFSEAFRRTSFVELKIKPDYRLRPQCATRLPYQVAPAIASWTSLLNTGNQRLTTLCLSLEQGGTAWRRANWDSGLLNALIRDANLPMLKNFGLQDAPVTNDVFCAFLLRHKHLENVRLYNCRVVHMYLANTTAPISAHELLSHPQSWDTVLDALRALPKLKRALVLVARAELSGPSLSAAKPYEYDATGTWVDLGFQNKNPALLYGKRKDRIESVPNTQPLKLLRLMKTANQA